MTHYQLYPKCVVDFDADILPDDLATALTGKMELVIEAAIRQVLRNALPPGPPTDVTWNYKAALIAGEAVPGQPGSFRPIAKTQLDERVERTERL